MRGSGGASPGQGSQDDSIEAHLHAIRAETAKKAARIQSLEAENASLYQICAGVDAVSNENRKLKAEVALLTRAAQAAEARTELMKVGLRDVTRKLAAAKSKTKALEAELEDVRAELAISKCEVVAREAALRKVSKELEVTQREVELLSQAPPELDALQADSADHISKIGDDNSNQDESDGNEERGAGDVGHDDNNDADDNINDHRCCSRPIREQDESDNNGMHCDEDNEHGDSNAGWLSRQPTKRSSARSLELELCTPSPRKRQKSFESTDEAQPTISPTPKDQPLSEDAAVSLISALEKSQPWNAMYAKSPSFSHTFHFEWLQEEAKKCILALQEFKSKFRRELWEQLHWVGFPSGGPLVTVAAASRAIRRQTAKTKWKELQELLIAMTTKDLLPKEIWTEPFLWIFRVEPLGIPSTCVTEASIASLDEKEPLRCFYVDCIDQHPFYETGYRYPKHALPGVIDGGDLDNAAV